MSKDNLLETIQLIIEEEMSNFFLNENQGNSFDWDFFKNISDMYDVKDYLDKTLQPVSKHAKDAGSSRIAYVLSNDKVLKIAKNNAGIAQNKAETDIASKSNSSIFTKIYDHHPNYIWIVAELVEPLVSSNMNRVAGIFGANIFPNTSYFNEFMGYMMDTKGDVDKALEKYEIKQVPWASKENPNIGKDIQNEQAKANIKHFFNELVDFAKKGNVVLDDMLHTSSLGISADDRIVVLDFGFTPEIGVKFYNYKDGKRLGFATNLNAK